MKNNNYRLFNAEGCLMDVVETTSFAKARKYFNTLYSGKYRIVWSTPIKDFSKKVVLS